MRATFRAFAALASDWVGSPMAFIVGLGLIVVWAITGPMFGYSDTWQLVVNTATTIVTFLMVFLIQNTQNRDARAIHLKLDELLRG
jgi:low affinity Fe/Cu permease